MKKKIALPWGRLGLRGRLFAAFGAVAALTVLASANALISYDGLGRSLGVVTGTSLPQVTRAARIAKEAAEVIAAAQALLAADAGERERALRALETERGDLVQAVNALPAEDAAKLKETAARMSENLDRLARAVADRQAIAAARVRMVEALRAAHQKLAEKLAPVADDAGFALVLGLQTTTDKRDLAAVEQKLSALANNELAALQAVLELRAESNLILGILVEAADLPLRERLPPIK